jgi:hypothetical protein
MGLDLFIASSRRMLQAELRLSPKKTHHISAWESQVRRMQQAYVVILAQSKAGPELARASQADLAMLQGYILEAEIGLEEARNGLERAIQ